MSNAKTGLMSALGALIGGALGATAGHYAARARPRRAGSVQEIEDAMVVGGATGAVVGAFFAGTAAGAETPVAQVQQLKAP